MSAVEVLHLRDHGVREATYSRYAPRWRMRQSWSDAMRSMQGSARAEEAVPEYADMRISYSTALMTPRYLKLAIPLSLASRKTVSRARSEARDIVHHRDDRLLVVVGPCSIHDPVAALEYARLLKAEALKHVSNLCIILRAYLEKPRTTTGWKGLVNDPNLNDQQDINKGLQVSRQLYSDIVELGVPVAAELLDLTTPQYLAEFISLGAIGARTTESQPHRAMASSLSFPIGFKNSTEGEVGVAVNSLSSCSCGHHFSNIADDGTMRAVHSTGNPDCFVILRGGNSGPNFSSGQVLGTQKLLAAANNKTGLMIDVSHGNSNKDYRNQRGVVKNVATQVAAGQNTIVGVMIESNLKEGKQSLGKNGLQGLQRGVSVTDGCIGWEATVDCLEQLSVAVGARREKAAKEP